MKQIAWKHAVIICSAAVATGSAFFAAAVISPDLIDRSATILSQEVNRAAKADRYVFPDEAFTVERNEKANGLHKPVASQVVFKSEPAHLEAPAPAAGAARKNQEMPSSFDDIAATPALTKDTSSTDGTTAPSNDVDTRLVVHPAADGNEKSTNVTVVPETSNASSK